MKENENEFMKKKIKKTLFREVKHYCLLSNSFFPFLLHFLFHLIEYQPYINSEIYSFSSPMPSALIENVASDSGRQGES